jgi:hypothetical protein
MSSIELQGVGYDVTQLRNTLLGRPLKQRSQGGLESETRPTHHHHPVSRQPHTEAIRNHLCPCRPLQ